MEQNKLPYDDSSPQDIERYAKLLLNKSLKDVFGGEIVQTHHGKGKFGQIVEELYFRYKPNNESRPDFQKAGVELKVAPLKKIKRGLTSKERLVFGMIDYDEESKKTFETSNFWAKNKLLLLMFYLWEKEQLDLDYLFKIIRLWQFPESDLKIIKEDWEKIIKKIKEGKAHELSEGDTFYLGACTKGADSTKLKSYSYSSKSAKPRAFSLKSKYLNYIIRISLDPNFKRLDVEPILKGKEESSVKDSFETIVINKFIPYINHSSKELIEKLSTGNIAKSKLYDLCRGILGVRKHKIEEFEKADVTMKTIVLEKTGTLKESMSFAQIKYNEIISEDWEDSYLFETLTKRFFFVVFQKNDNNIPILKKAFFWTMPQTDLEIAEKFWQDTKNKIEKDDYGHFIKSSEDKICHVRPKGKNSRDLMDTPSGRKEKKMCYWLNRGYIKNIIED